MVGLYLRAGLGLMLACALLVSGAVAAGAASGSDIIAYECGRYICLLDVSFGIRLNVRLSGEEVAASYPVWSPDGEKLAYAGAAYNAATGAYENSLFIRQLSGRLVAQVPYAGEGWLVRDWSAQTGQLLIESYIVASRRIFEISEAGEIGRTLFESSDTQLYTYPLWSPDGTQLAVHFSDISRLEHRLYLTNADTSRIERVVSRNLYPMAWSADGTRLLALDVTSPGFSAYFLDSGAQIVDRFEVENGYRVYPTVSSRNRLSWSPDDRRLVLESSSIDFRDELYIVNADGTGIRFLTTGRSPAWRP